MGADSLKNYRLSVLINKMSAAYLKLSVPGRSGVDVGRIV